MRHHRYYTRRRQQAKKPRRQLLLACFFSTILLLSGYGVLSFVKDSSKSSNTTIASQVKLTEDVPLAWPTTGKAAVGSIEDGLLARSSKNETPRPTASMAKVITALAIMEKQPFELGETGQSYTLTSKDVAYYQTQVAQGGSALPVHAGMTLTQHEAMQAMLIASSNNLAETLAERTFGSEEAYVEYAQSMVERMGLSQTTIADASGFNPATTSTPSDLVAIGITALKNPVIADIVAQPEAQITDVGIIKNTNELLRTDGAVGIKTGTTNEAGSCLLFAANYATKSGGGITLVGVIMGDVSAATLFNDSRKLLVSAKQEFDLTDNRQRVLN